MRQPVVRGATTILNYLKSHPSSIHILLALVVGLYGIFGGLMLYWFEAEHAVQLIEEEDRRIVECFREKLALLANRSTDDAVDDLFSCVVEPLSGRKVWTTSGAIVYAIAMIITVGGKFKLRTDGGRLFAIAYAIVGIPVALSLLANVGKFVSEFYEWVQKRVGAAGSSFVGGFLGFFALYVLVAALALSWKSGFVNAVYNVAMSLIAIDMIGAASDNLLELTICIVYVTFGLALVTIGIEILSGYVKKLHNYGKKFTNGLKVLLWFGGTTMSAETLTRRIGKTCDVPDEKLQDCLNNFDVLCQPEFVDPTPVVVAPETVEESESSPQVSNGMADSSASEDEEKAPTPEPAEPEPKPPEPEPEPPRAGLYQLAGVEGFKHLFNMP